MGYKMRYSGGGPRQTSPLYQEITKSVDKDGNIVTTTSTKGTPGTPGYTIKGTPPTPPAPPVEKPAVKYPPTGPGESVEEANARWTEYKKNNPSPTPTPPTPTPIVTPPTPGGNTPPSSASNVGSKGTPDVVVPPVAGTPGSSSSTIKKAPAKPTTGTLSTSINNEQKTKGSLMGPNLNLNIKGPNLRPVGRAVANVALLPFDLLRGVFKKGTCPGGCNKQRFGESIGVLGGRQSISSKLRNRKL